MVSNSYLIFIILAFTLGGVLIMKRDTIPTPLKKWMALTAVIMVCLAFYLIVYSSLNIGSNPQ
ncbi:MULTISPECIES: hypothetical protein [unclassified Paenibacillus]|uniref:hypothetical protein n=1 Tax=unclassified Paenibacillus TaxID=185978 RepID=UPI0020B6C33F|nr:hypothetical protein [Paenibacillus sp. MZ03-122A]MCP3777218.1 hypothetical protein [Paenibacillus sp. MZ03-122A]